MRLSMWVLADWLSFENVRVDIQEGPRELRNARLLPSSGELSRSTVYLDADGNGNVFCMCGTDLIVVPSAEIDPVLNSILDCFEHFNDLGARLRDLVSNGADVEAVLDEAGRTLGRFFVVADTTYFIHASGGDRTALSNDEAMLDSLSNRTMPLSAVMHVNKQQGIRTRGRESYLVDVAPLDSVAAVSNFFNANHHEGWLVSIGSHPVFTQGDLHLQDGIAPIVHECLQANADDELRMDRAAVLADLLESGPAGRDMADKRLATLGWNIDDPKRIYAVRQYDPSKNPNHVVSRFLERIDPTLVVVASEGTSFLFANMLLVDEFQLESEMTPILVTCGCVAGKSPRFIDSGEAASQASAAREAAKRAGARNRIVDFAEVKLDYALSVLRSCAVADVHHEALAVLEDYDATHKTELLKTLRVYLACSRFATASSEALFIHRSTLLYRLERIAEIGKIDLQDPDTCFHLDLSLRLWPA